MAKKTFRGYQSPEDSTIELESPDGSRAFEARLVPVVPGSVILDFTSKVDAEEPATLANAVNDLFQAAIVPEDWDGFKAFIDDPANGIDMALLSDISNYVAEVYMERPTQPASLSTATP